MTRTAEQIAADNQLDDAIRGCLHAYDMVEPGDVVATWIVVAGLHPADDDDPDATVTLQPGGTQPTWAAAGLLHLGLGAVTASS